MTDKTTAILSGYEDRVALAKNVRDLHANFSLAGNPSNALLQIPDEQLQYVLSILREESPLLPDMTAAEWAALYNLLGDQQIVPVFYRNLRSVSPALCPPENLFSKLKTTYIFSTRYSVIREKQLEALLGAFREKGVRVIVLKGLAYSLSLYPEPELRSCADIDLLVRPADVVSCRDLLESLGYKCVERRIEASADGFFEEVFTPANPRSGVLNVEIHWNLYPYAAVNDHVDTNQLFSRARTVNTRCGKLEVLDPVDAIIHSASHMIYNHGHGIRLNWIYDMLLLCQALRSPSDWEALKSRSVEYGARLAVEESLTMAEYWTRLQIPPGSGDFSLWPPPNEYETLTFSAAMGGRIRDHLKMIFPRSLSLSQKAGLLFRLIFPSRDMMNHLRDAPGKPLPLAYLNRWRRLLKKL